MNIILDFVEILKLDLFFPLFGTLCYGNYFAFVAETEVFLVLGYLKPTHQCIVAKSYCVSNDTPVQFSKTDLIKLFKDIIVRNSKSTARPLGSLKPSILQMCESKRKNEFTHHIVAKTKSTCKYCTITPLITIVMSIVFE